MGEPEDLVAEEVPGPVPLPGPEVIPVQAPPAPEVLLAPGVVAFGEQGGPGIHKALEMRVGQACPRRREIVPVQGGVPRMALQGTDGPPKGIREHLPGEDLYCVIPADDGDRVPRREGEEVRERDRFSDGDPVSSGK